MPYDPTTDQPRFGRFSFLTFSLIAYIFLLFPLRSGQPGGGFILHIVFTGILVAAVYACAWKTRHFIVALLLGAPAVVLHWVGTVSVDSGMLYAELLFGAAFLIYTAAVIIGHILRVHAISYDTISGAIAAYLLVGVAWSLLYGLIQTIDPSAILLPAAHEVTSAISPQVPGRPASGSFLYYSFVTLTTLGYGDILPVSPAARALATLEAVVGQIYLAILVARLVGLHIAQNNNA